MLFLPSFLLIFEFLWNQITNMSVKTRFLVQNDLIWCDTVEVLAKLQWKMDSSGWKLLQQEVRVKKTGRAGLVGRTGSCWHCFIIYYVCLLAATSTTATNRPTIKTLLNLVCLINKTQQQRLNVSELSEVKRLVSAQSGPLNLDLELELLISRLWFPPAARQAR